MLECCDNTSHSIGRVYTDVCGVHVVHVAACKRLTRTQTSLHSGIADDDDASKVMQLGGDEFFSVALKER